MFSPDFCVFLVQICEILASDNIEEHAINCNATELHDPYSSSSFSAHSRSIVAVGGWEPLGH